jgi:hypothetical protein
VRGRESGTSVAALSGVSVGTVALRTGAAVGSPVGLPVGLGVGAGEGARVDGAPVGSFVGCIVVGEDEIGTKVDELSGVFVGSVVL